MRLFCKLLLIFILTSSFFSEAALKSGVFMKANNVHYNANNDSVEAVGDILIKIDSYNLTADKIYYDIKKDVIFAEGDIRITDDTGKIIYGRSAVFKDKLKRGIIEEFIAKLDKDSIVASRIANRLSKNHLVLSKSVFTPCKISCGNKPIWQVKSSHTDIDYDKQKITYKNAFFELYGIPIIYLPYFFHATPKSPARSGLLNPRIKNGSFVMPFYFRVKSNVDFTISPRIHKNYTIFEGEFRHKVKSGQYKVLGSYGNPEFKKQNNKVVETKSNPHRFHIFSSGDFVKDNINYGFDFKRASDKAYLTNYHDIYDSYLASKIYVNTINKRDYLSLEGLAFQDLRSKETELISDPKSDIKLPLVFPSINTQHVFSLNDDESLLFNVRNNSIFYNEKNRQLTRVSMDLELMNNLISNGGHMINFTVANRSDLYRTSFVNANVIRKKDNLLYRNIPEFRTSWRYPLSKSLSSKSSVTIEPITMLVVGTKFKPGLKKFELIDSRKKELSENNIFKANSFSGIDAHDYGNRFSYGINSSLMSGYLYLNGFLGQMLHQNNVTKEGHSDYIGSISMDIASNVELFYRFHKDRKLRSIRNEIGASSNSEKFISDVIFTELNNVSRYCAKDRFKTKQTKVTQVKFGGKYQLIKDLWLGMSSRLDLTSKPTKILNKTIQVTYLFDCVSINGTISENFLHDSTRDVKKTRSYSFSVGLKVINM